MTTKVEMETPKAERETEVTLPEVIYTPGTHDEIWAAIDEKYGESSYKALISAYVESIMPKTEGKHKTSVTRQSVAKYMKVHATIKAKFMREAEDLEDAFDEAKEEVQENTRTRLAILRSALEGGRKLVEYDEKIPPPESEDAIEDYFEGYLEALNGRYINKHANAGKIIPETPITLFGIVVGLDVMGSEDYDKKSEEFQDNMERWVEAKLNWLMDHDPSPAKLEAFKKEITARYNFYSRIDGDESIISSADLAVLEQCATPPFDTLGRMMDESDERVIKRLEVMHLMDFSKWEHVVELAGNAVVHQAVNNGTAVEFVKQVNAYRKKMGYEPVDKDFYHAMKAFREMLEDIQGVGVRETLAFLRQFTSDVNGEILDKENDVQPASLKPQVSRQLDYLLGGILVPQKPTDRMLVRFMTADRETRNEMLQHEGTRQILFKAIRQATQQYPQIYRRMFRNIPEDASKLKFSPRIRKPTYHDRAAQMQALIILGKQSKVIVEKLNKAPEHRDADYIAEIEGAKLPEDINSVTTGLRFKPATQRNAPYVSALHRGGFNTRDLALKGAKIFGAFTVLANVAQSWGEAGQSSEDFVDHIMKTVELTATNHAAIAAAAVTVGAGMAERDPRILKWPWLSRYEQEGIRAGFKLDNLHARLGHKEVTRFLNNPAEWRAMDHNSMTADVVGQLLKDARSNAKKGMKPVITVEAMRKVIPDESIITTLTRGGRSSRMRFLFYEKFLQGKSKPDISHIKGLCTGSEYISSSPVTQTA